MTLWEKLVKAWDYLVMGAEKNCAVELYVKNAISKREYLQRVDDAEQRYRAKHKKQPVP